MYFFIRKGFWTFKNWKTLTALNRIPSVLFKFDWVCFTKTHCFSGRHPPFQLSTYPWTFGNGVGTFFIIKISGVFSKLAPGMLRALQTCGVPRDEGPSAEVPVAPVQKQRSVKFTRKAVSGPFPRPVPKSEPQAEGDARVATKGLAPWDIFSRVPLVAGMSGPACRPACLD